MNKDILGTTNQLEKQRFYYGTRAELKPGDLIDPDYPPNDAASDRTTTYVYLTPNLDAAIWEAELATGERPGRVYIVEPIGQIVDASELTDKTVSRPSMGVILFPRAVAGHGRSH